VLGKKTQVLGGPQGSMIAGETAIADRIALLRVEFEGNRRDDND
jgi:hypothetical protein